MLGADGLNLALMVADSGIIDSAVNDLMARSQVMMMAENRGVKSSVKGHLLKWRGSVKKRITKVCETERFHLGGAWRDQGHWPPRGDWPLVWYELTVISRAGLQITPALFGKG